jgi:RNA polymerase sigma factor (sigma-70 family)
MLLRFCRSLVAPADAEDVWSETFLAALKAYPALDSTTNVAAWLVTIARRKAIDGYRRRRREAVFQTSADENSGSTPGPEPADGELLMALATLSERQRTAVVCHHVLGYPFTEVASILGSTPAAARRSSADGMAKLRAAYQPLPTEGDEPR